MFDATTINEKEFQQLRELIYQHAGIALNDSKRELLRARLSKRLRVLGLKSFNAYYEYVLSGDASGQELTVMLDSISTNKTDFFREIQHFHFLRETILPELRQRLARQPERELRVWSAGCSTGEEPYSLALTLLEENQCATPRARILASDISMRALEAAQEGLYSAGKVAPVAPPLLKLGFTRVKRAQEVLYQVNDAVRSLVTFRHINLMDERWPIRAPLHLIFCRNVMIYFDRPTQQRLSQRFYDHLQPGGYLFIGHSESFSGIQTPLRFVRPTVYQKAG